MNEIIISKMNEYQKIAALLPRNANDKKGILAKPEILAIYSGERTYQSLNFALQIDTRIYETHVKLSFTTSDKITVQCKGKGCKYKADIRVRDPKLIIAEQCPKRNRHGNYTYIWRYTLNVFAEESRYVHNYEVR